MAYELPNPGMLKALLGAMKVREILAAKGVSIYKTVVGEYATSMEMAGASISICKMNDELKKYMDHPVCTPFICQK